MALAPTHPWHRKPSKHHHHKQQQQQQLNASTPTGSRARSIRKRQQGARRPSAMGGCFSSGLAGEDAAGYGGEKTVVRVWPSDEDGGLWPYYVGERDVDNKASIFIANFHRHQSGVCDCPDQQQTPAAAV